MMTDDSKAHSPLPWKHEWRGVFTDANNRLVFVLRYPAGTRDLISFDEMEANGDIIAERVNTWGDVAIAAMDAGSDLTDIQSRLTAAEAENARLRAGASTRSGMKHIYTLNDHEVVVAHPSYAPVIFDFETMQAKPLPTTTQSGGV